VCIWFKIEHIELPAKLLEVIKEKSINHVSGLSSIKQASISLSDLVQYGTLYRQHSREDIVGADRTPHYSPLHSDDDESDQLLKGFKRAYSAKHFIEFVFIRTNQIVGRIFFKQSYFAGKKVKNGFGRACVFVAAALMRAAVPIPAVASASVVHSAAVGGSVVGVVGPL